MEVSNTEIEGTVPDDGQEAHSQTHAESAESAESAEKNAETKPDAGSSTGGKDEPQEAPEKYEFSDDVKAFAGEHAIAALSDVSRDLNLSQASAQKIIDKVGPAIERQQADALEALDAQWIESVKSDKEIGGDKLEESLATAKKALDAFGSDELRELLNETRLGNHPEIVKFMIKAGKAASEDDFVPGRDGNTPVNDARRLYAASNMNP